jgi:hypothetical protein
MDKHKKIMDALVSTYIICWLILIDFLILWFDAIHA